MIPYGRQDITSDDIDSVTEVLNSAWITQGPTIELFEKSIKSHCHAQHAIAVSNATAALHIACLALGLRKDDILWTTPNTFVASANCGLYCGAIVDFVDIDERTYNMDMQLLEHKLHDAKNNGTLPKIVIPVHFSGQSCDMSKLKELAMIYKFKIIEDASHAIGGYYSNEPIGKCTYSDITVFSFHPVKIITTGEGGALTTNDPQLAEKLRLLRSHGITRDPSHMTDSNPAPWCYEQIDLGFNYRMTDIQAALGASQITRLKSYVQTRTSLAQNYNALLKNLPVILPYQHQSSQSAWHLYVIRIELSHIKKTRLEVFKSLRALGIGVNIHYIPVHMQPYYSALGFKRGMFPKSECYYDEALSLPLFPIMTEAEQTTVVKALEKTLQ